MSENEIKNITPAHLPQGDVDYYDEYQDFRGMTLFMLLILSMSMIPCAFGGTQIFGFDITGWAWVVPLIISGLVVLGNMRNISFPVNIWLPWIFILTVYWFQGRNNIAATQNFMQMLSPLVVGCAASIFRPDNLQFDKILYWITNFIWIALILLIIKMPALLSGQLPMYGFMGPSMIGFLLFGACYSAFYACGSNRHILYYLATLGMALISHGRGPILAMLSCLPLTLAPLKMKMRIIVVLAMAVIAVALFSTDRMQRRMFYSGSGEISDVRWDNPDLQTNGRKGFYQILWLSFENNPVLGNGFNSHREVMTKSGITTVLLPHNDWLKLLHDMGIFGAGFYLLTMLLQIFLLFRIARWSTGGYQMLAYGAASAFIPYMLIMFTDNVILYVQFFGNVHFALIGLIYGAVQRDIETAEGDIYQ